VTRVGRIVSTFIDRQHLSAVDTILFHRRRRRAVSSGQCATGFDQEFVQGFGRVLLVEGLPGSAVQFVGDGVEVGLGVTDRSVPLGSIGVAARWTLLCLSRGCRVFE